MIAAASRISLLLSLFLIRSLVAQPLPVPTGSVEDALHQIAKAGTDDYREGPIRAQLDVFELELGERMAGVTDGLERARILTRYFFDEERFTASPDIGDPDNFYVHRMLTKRQGYCLSLSAMILAVARRLDLPLSGVVSPRHFFLRYDDGQLQRNIETTEKGKARSDTSYRKKGMTDAAVRDGRFLRSLTDREVIGCLLNNDGFLRWQAGQSVGAAERFRQALALHPGLVDAAINLGVVAGARGDLKEARLHFDEVLKLLPKDGSTFLNRALGALHEEAYVAALEDVAKAEQLDPDNPHLLCVRDMILASVLSPATWERHQARVHQEGETLRAQGKLSSGLLGRYYRDQDQKTLGATRVDATIDFEWRWGPPHPGLPSDAFSIRWDGWVLIPKDGAYTVVAVYNDGLRARLDGIPLIDDWKRNEGGLASESVTLKKGLHRLAIDYFEHTKFAGVTFAIKRADSATPLPPSAYWHETPP